MVSWPKDDIIHTPLYDPIFKMSQLEKYRGMEGLIYKDVRLLVHMFKAPEDVLQEFLPEGFSTGHMGTMIALIAEYPNTTLGPYKEAALFVECQYKETVGMHTAYMYIDAMHGDHSLGADKALIVGREMLGMPKTLADIQLDLEGDRHVGTVKRNGREIMRIEGDVNEQADFPDIGTIINVRAMPTPDGKGYSYRDVCKTDLEYKPSATKAGQGKIEFPVSDEAIRNALVEENIITFSTVTDFCIPPGEILDVIKDGE